MIAWPSPFLPVVPGSGGPLRIHDTASGEPHEIPPEGPATMYVCGITPYDATHIGHAATYVTFDIVGRTLRDAGHDVVYVQNVTDVDDPLLERAERDGRDWAELAREETALFTEDMTALQVIAPDHFIGAVESIPLIVKAIEELEANGAAYRLDAPEGGEDVYFDATARSSFGNVSHLSFDEMLALFAERGGDPERPGKRNELDPLLWRARRDGEPSWPGGSLGDGRPGWHIECATIAQQHLGLPFDIQGGGTDLIFPHHEMSAGHGEALAGVEQFAGTFAHQAMVGFDGEKMSKSKGNLVFVSALRESGVEPMAIRLALLAHHYRTPWEWSDAVLAEAQDRLARWRAGLSTNGGPDADATVAELRARLADDLDTPGALAAVDAWVARSLEEGGTVEGAPGIVGRACDALLGVRV
ncbi:MAG TPA: cysteine--1-D-myo-inosityl 2-amino-2-deoxy-alpha-D-glucopyranoside ligase [Lapillicoccus sp.]|nr:cysteine--1-D-myo-inosityl 2-amino-2-deoxy-alpha-D-glucopyranoside ligase [Lapillicoccus sp.]